MPATINLSVSVLYFRPVFGGVRLSPALRQLHPQPLHEASVALYAGLRNALYLSGVVSPVSTARLSRSLGVTGHSFGTFP